MVYSKLATVTILAASLGAFTSSAWAQDPATSLSCLKMSRQVKDALARQQQTPAAQSAAQEQKIGTDYCTKGFYKVGMEHYESALKMIGGNASADAG